MTVINLLANSEFTNTLSTYGDDGVYVDADTLPGVSLLRNGGLQDVAVTVSDVGVGQYAYTAVIPSDWEVGDDVSALITAAIGGVTYEGTEYLGAITYPETAPCASGVGTGATTRKLIEQALRAIGVLAGGESASDQDINDSLDVAKQMLDAWRIENLMVPGRLAELFDVSDTALYSMGPGGDFDTVMPIEISSVRFYPDDGNSYVLDMVELAAWQDICSNNVGYPGKVYIEEGAPFFTLRFDVIPVPGGKIQVFSAKPLSDLPALDDSVTYPAGYEKAIKYNLAVELAPLFETEASQTVIAMAAGSKSIIKRKNVRTNTLKFDVAITPSPSYDIYAGPG